MECPLKRWFVYKLLSVSNVHSLAQAAKLPLFEFFDFPFDKAQILHRRLQKSAQNAAKKCSKPLDKAQICTSGCKNLHKILQKSAAKPLDKTESMFYNAIE